MDYIAEIITFEFSPFYSLMSQANLFPKEILKIIFTFIIYLDNRLQFKEQKRTNKFEWSFPSTK